MEKIYVDYAATTPVRPEVIKAMEPYWSEIFGNHSEPHGWGQQARVATVESRNKIADFLGAKIQAIIFTYSATETINLAHKGFVEAVGNRSSVA